MTNTKFKNKVRTDTIGGMEIQIYILGALEGFEMAKELAVIFAPILGAIKEGESDVDFKAAALSMASTLGEANILAITTRLLKDLCVDGVEITFDDYFAANYGALVQILAFALKENVSSFFSLGDIFQT